MGIPLEGSFAVFTCLGAVLFAASSAGALAGRRGSLLLPVTIAALVSMLISVVSIEMYLGHPERIFGAIANLRSVFSRELIALFLVIVLAATFVYRLFKGQAIPRTLSAISVVVALALLVFTGQLVQLWVSHRLMLSGVGPGM